MPKHATDTETSMSITRRRVLQLTAAAGALVGLRPISAKAQADNAASVASLSGPDRTQKLIEGAKREGTVSFYSNAPTSDNTAIVGGFEKKYGVKVKLYRASSEEIRQRVIRESGAGRADVDFILNNAPAMEALTQEKLLQEIKSPVLADLMPQAIPPHRQWAGFALNILIPAYNTDQIKKDDLPKSYEDLLDPKWKGKLGIEADDSDWFGGLMDKMGQDKGEKLFRDIVARNGISVRKGHTLLANLVAAGEVPLALTIFNYTAAQLKKKGAPVDWFLLEPVISMTNSVAVAKSARNPNAAVLFFDYMLSDAQKILAKREYSVTNLKVPSDIDRSKITVLDAATMLRDGEKWESIYKKIFVGR